MTETFTMLGQLLLSTTKDVIPIAAIIFGFQFLVIRKSIPNLGRIIVGFTETMPSFMECLII